MKCKNCGNNLEIDNAFCPYCGTPNPVAKKHREDMKKYERDYDATKREVLSNSRRVSDRAIKITAIALTVAAIAVLIPFVSRTDSLGRSAQKSKAASNSEQYLPQLQELIKAEDYLAVNELAKAHMLNQYSVYDGKYSAVFSVSSMYSDLLQEIGIVLDKKGQIPNGAFSTIGWDIKSIGSRVKDKYDISEECEEYLKHIERDTILLLETYLNISEEQYYEMQNISDSKRNLMVEEAVNELRGKK